MRKRGKGGKGDKSKESGGGGGEEGERREGRGRMKGDKISTFPSVFFSNSHPVYFTSTESPLATAYIQTNKQTNKHTYIHT